MKWAIDPMHSIANFSIRHMMSKVRGTVSVKEGWIEADEKQAPSSAKVEVVLDTATIKKPQCTRRRKADSFNSLGQRHTEFVSQQKRALQQARRTVVGGQNVTQAVLHEVGGGDIAGM